MTPHRESKLQPVRTAEVLEGVDMSPLMRASARGYLERAEAIVDGTERIVQSVAAAFARLGDLSAAWRLKSVPRG